MANNKTRLQKAQTEIRKLKRQNDDLRIVNEALSTRLAEVPKREEEKSSSLTIKKNVFLYIYDTVVSALILVFVYWIAINGYECFDIPYLFFGVLVVLISLKCLFDNKQVRFVPILRTILNDLIKPAMSMLIGLFLCMLCLGEGWKGAKGYALDVGYTIILVTAVTIIVLTE